MVSTLFSLLRLLGFVAIGAGWLVPNHYLPWSSAYNEAAAVIGLLLLALSAGRHLATVRPAAVVGVLLATATIPAWQYMSGLLVFSGDMWVATLYLVLFAAAVAVGQLGAGGQATTLPVDGIASATLVASALSALVAIAQALHSSFLASWIVEVAPGDRPFGNLAQPNNLATLLGLGAVALLLLVERRRIGRVAVLPLFALLAVGAALTVSRTALLFGPIVLAITWIARRRGVALDIRHRRVAVAVLAQWAFAAAWSIAAPWVGDSSTLSLAERGVSTPRLRMWPILIDSSLQQPWHGFGFLQVGEAELLSVNRYPPIEELWLHGHDIFLEFVLWCGYPLGLLLAFLVVGWFVTRLQSLRSPTGVFAFCAVAIVGFHALLELPHHYLYFLIPTGLWIGVVEAESGRARTLPAPMAAVPLVIGMALFVAIAKDYPAVEEDFRLMRFETRHIGNLKAAQPAPDAPFLSSLAGFLRFARTEPRAGMSPAELEAMEAIARRYPYGPSLLKLATALALNGREAEARERMISIRHLYDEGTYRKLRADLRASVDDGRTPSLRQFEWALPDGR